MQIASITSSLASMLQYPSVTPADGMVLNPDMFGYGRLVREAFDACVLTLLQTWISSLSLLGMLSCALVCIIIPWHTRSSYGVGVITVLVLCVCVCVCVCVCTSRVT